jgi:hypothetical protein
MAGLFQVWVMVASFTRFMHSFVEFSSIATLQTARWVGHAHGVVEAPRTLGCYGSHTCTRICLHQEKFRLFLLAPAGSPFEPPGVAAAISAL